jgi:hypothetical protein
VDGAQGEFGGVFQGLYAAKGNGGGLAMKGPYQAKTIQSILGIPKHRYEYIVSKIGIKPEVEEVEGQGRTHLYSFRNLLQISICHHASRMGLTPGAIRDFLGWLDKSSIYSEKTDRSALVAYFVFKDNGRFVMVEKEAISTAEGFVCLNLEAIKKGVIFFQ